MYNNLRLQFEKAVYKKPQIHFKLEYHDVINFPIFDISLSDKKAQHINSQPKLFHFFFNAVFSRKKNQLNDF